MSVERIPNGTLIEKINSKPDDGHRDGARGIVVEAVGPLPNNSPHHPGQYGYFVRWEDFPAPVLIAGHRIRVVADRRHA